MNTTTKGRPRATTRTPADPCADDAARLDMLAAAEARLGWPLHQRGSDRLDFHDVGAETMRRELLAAFEAGVKFAR